MFALGWDVDELISHLSKMLSKCQVTRILKNELWMLITIIYHPQLLNVYSVSVGQGYLRFQQFIGIC